MWNKLGGVAGNLRSTVTQFATDFVDRTEELSQQVGVRAPLHPVLPALVKGRGVTHVPSRRIVSDGS